MFTVTVPQQCGCFKRSDFSESQNFENKDDALMHASEMTKTMNDTFCKKHAFTVIEEGNNFVIALCR